MVPVMVALAGCSGGGSATPDEPRATRTIDVTAIEKPEFPEDSLEPTSASAEHFVRWWLASVAWVRRTNSPRAIGTDYESTRCTKCDLLVEEVLRAKAADTLEVLTEPVIDEIESVRTIRAQDNTCTVVMVSWHVDHQETVAADGTVSNRRDDLAFVDAIVTCVNAEQRLITYWEDRTTYQGSA
ncbi:MAG: hypothetical protein Q7T71_18490 [Herbiconiux sp.]|nr:hypothetical protein [Herbiconiux sp.]